MINGPVAALQLILIIASLAIVLYALLIKGVKLPRLVEAVDF